MTDVGGWRSGFALRTRAGKAALPDFNRAEVRSWWGEMHAAFCADGIAQCAVEPARWGMGLRGGRRLLQADPADSKRTLPQEQVRNLYGLQHSRATWAALESIGRERRPFVLTHTGTTGIQWVDTDPSPTTPYEIWFYQVAAYSNVCPPGSQEGPW